MKTISLLVAIGLIAESAGVAAEQKGVENLALRAEFHASSVYSGDYTPEHVADGVIPAAMSHADVGKAWCARGNQHPGGVSLSMEWPQPVDVAEVVYYGRTAWQWEENWRKYEVYVDEQQEPVFKGSFEQGHGPQRVRLQTPVRVRKLTLKFLDSYGGSNPGASEICVFSTSPPDAMFGKFQKVQTAAGVPVLELAESRQPNPQLAADLKTGRLGFNKLLVIQRHHINCSHVYTYHCEGQSDGGGLFNYDVTSGDLEQILDASAGQILSYDVSFDGKELLVAWRNGPGPDDPQRYQIYRMNVDGSDLRQLTRGDHDNFDPVWLPDGGIAFLSTRTPLVAYCWTSLCGVLHRMDDDGANVRRISWNYLNDFTPALLNDGRLLYGRWEYVDRPAIPIQGLWALNPDGTDLSGFFGNRVLDPATFIEARPVPGSHKVICTMTGHNGTLRGAIGLIDITRGDNAPESILNLTPDVRLVGVDRSSNGPRGPYQTPYPLCSQYYLVSYDGTILLRELQGASEEVVLKPCDGMGFYYPQPIRSRPRPPVRASVLSGENEPWATIVLQDIYNGLGSGVERGEIKRLMVVEEMAKPSVGHSTGFGFQRPVVSCGATYTPKRVWGSVDVKPDGSAHFRVPAERPIYFLPLDEQGRVVQRMRTFTHLMPGEVQGCVGCHESRNGATPHLSESLGLALEPPQELTPPDWGVRGFDYASIVQPVLDKHCVSCHNAREAAAGVDLTGDLTEWFNVSYDVLAYENSTFAGLDQVSWRSGSRFVSWISTMNGTEANILQIAPKTWGSPQSKLADFVLTGHPDQQGKPLVNLNADERQRILTWIDVNVPYYGTSTTTHQEWRGGRALQVPQLAEVLKEVGSRRCAECHSGSPPLGRVRFTNVENNAFLLAPLAKSAGGTEQCGKAVFADKNDPDYQKLLRLFESITRALTENPRQDMPGSHRPDCEVCEPPACTTAVR